LQVSNIILTKNSDRGFARISQMCNI